jgi:hypothetical protein
LIYSAYGKIPATGTAHTIYFCAMTPCLWKREAVEPGLKFEDFVRCFRKQFIFQKGKGSGRSSRYFTDYNSEQGMQHDQWGIMAFIHTGAHYGYSDNLLRKELNIPINLYETLKEEAAGAVKPDYPDQQITRKILTKAGLVKNCVRCFHGV